MSLLNYYLNLSKSATNLQSGLHCPHCRICHKEKKKPRENKNDNRVKF